MSRVARYTADFTPVAKLVRDASTVFGLANDQLGYFIPKRQWDDKPPYCYGRKSSQYGEVNSVGPNAARIVCESFRGLVKSPARPK